MQLFGYSLLVARSTDENKNLELDEPEHIPIAIQNGLEPTIIA